MIGNTGNTHVHTMQGCTPRKVRGIPMAKRTKRILVPRRTSRCTLHPRKSLEALQIFRHSDLLPTRDAPAAARERRVCLRVEAALKQRLRRYELPEELRLEHRLEHDAFDAFDDRYRGMARRLDQRLKAPQSTSKHVKAHPTHESTSDTSKRTTKTHLPRSVDRSTWSTGPG